VAAWLPFGADAVSFVAGAALVATLRGWFAVGQHDHAGSPTSLRAEIAEGLRFLPAHRVLRTLAGMVGAFRAGVHGRRGDLVLFAQQELGLGSFGFGLLLAAIAVGGLPGNLQAAAVGQRLRAGTLLIGGTLVTAAAWLAVGLAPTAWMVAAALVVIGLVGSTWDVAQPSLRQTLIPDRLLGRVISAFRLVGFGPAPIGALPGGVLGRTLGLRAPFGFGGVVLAVMAPPAVNTRSVDAATSSRHAPPPPMVLPDRDQRWRGSPAAARADQPGEHESPEQEREERDEPAGTRPAAERPQQDGHGDQRRDHHRWGQQRSPVPPGGRPALGRLPRLAQRWQVGERAAQVLAGARAERGLHPLGELLPGQAPVDVMALQQLDRPLPIRVGHADLRSLVRIHVDSSPSRSAFISLTRRRSRSLSMIAPLPRSVVIRTATPRLRRWAQARLGVMAGRSQAVGCGLTSSGCPRVLRRR
jgi:Transmembrane secretion effector